MKLITKAIEKQLEANHLRSIAAKPVKPVLKLFGGSSATWLITDIDPDGDTLFGLCDLGMGTPELGYVSLSELKSIKFPPFGLPIERDRWFEADKTLTDYWLESKECGFIKS